MPWSGCQAQSEDQGMYHMWEGGSIYIPDASIPGILPYSISEMQPPFLHPKSRKLGKLFRAFGPFQRREYATIKAFH